jgi:hypothetical protein
MNQNDIINSSNMDEITKAIDDLDNQIMRIRIPPQTIPRLEIIEQQLKYYKEKLVYYETVTYRNSVSKEKAIEDVKDATIKFRFFIVQKEVELEKTS